MVPRTGDLLRAELKRRLGQEIELQIGRSSSDGDQDKRRRPDIPSPHVWICKNFNVKLCAWCHSQDDWKQFNLGLGSFWGRDRRLHAWLPSQDFVWLRWRHTASRQSALLRPNSFSIQLWQLLGETSLFWSLRQGGSRERCNIFLLHEGTFPVNF